MCFSVSLMFYRDDKDIYLISNMYVLCRPNMVAFWYVYTDVIPGYYRISNLADPN